MARTFNGTTDRLQYASLTPTTSFTFAVWAYRTGAGGGSLGELIDWSGDIFRLSSTTMQFTADWTGTDGVWSITAPALNEWHHFTITYNGSATTNDPLMYLDGASQTVTEAVAPSTARDNTADNLRVGNSSASRAWAGAICEVAVWNRVLTAGEAAALGKGASPLIIPNGLVFYAPLIRDTGFSLGGGSPTVTGTTVSDHPRVFYGGGSREAPPAPAAAVTFAPSVVGASTLTATVRTRARIAATITGASTVTATVRTKALIAATVVGASTVTVVVRTTPRFAPAVVGASTVSVALKTVPRFTATIAGVSTVSVQLRTTPRFAVTVAGSSIVTVALKTVPRLTVTITGSSTFSAVVSSPGVVVFVPHVVGASTVSVALRTRPRLSASVAGVSTISASVTTPPPVYFAPAIVGSSSVATILRTTPRIAATVFSTSTAVFALRTRHFVSASIVGASTVTVGLVVVAIPKLTVTVVGSSTVTVGLVVRFIPTFVVTIVELSSVTITLVFGDSDAAYTLAETPTSAYRLSLAGLSAYTAGDAATTAWLLYERLLTVSWTLDEAGTSRYTLAEARREGH